MTSYFLKDAHTEMIEGHPFSYGSELKDKTRSTDERLISDETSEIQEKVFNWIAGNIFPRKTPLNTTHSCALKHALQRDTGIYLTNNAFKDAMLHCGFEPIDYNELNWKFRISKKSPAFKIKK